MKAHRFALILMERPDAEVILMDPQQLGWEKADVYYNPERDAFCVSWAE